MCNVFLSDVLKINIGWCIWNLNSVIGGTYLFYLGYKSMRLLAVNVAQKINVVEPAPSTVERNNFNAQTMVKKGMLTTLSNPKVALLWVGMSSVIPVNSDQLGWLILYSTVVACIVFAVYGIIASLFSTTQARAKYLRYSKPINIVFAIVFILLGGIIIITHGLK